MSYTFDSWTIYDSPDDLPGRFIARRWVIGIGAEPEPTTDTREGATLDEVRAKLPIGLVRIPRAEADEPAIVETWI